MPNYPGNSGNDWQSCSGIGQAEKLVDIEVSAPEWDQPSRLLPHTKGKQARSKHLPSASSAQKAASTAKAGSHLGLPFCKKLSSFGSRPITTCLDKHPPSIITIPAQLPLPTTSSTMDDEPILDCIVVAARTDRSSTMASRTEQSSSSPRPDAGKDGGAARGVLEQSQTKTTSSSGSKTAIPPSGHVSVCYIRFLISDTSAFFVRY